MGYSVPLCVQQFRGLEMQTELNEILSDDAYIGSPNSKEAVELLARNWEVDYESVPRNLIDELTSASSGLAGPREIHCNYTLDKGDDSARDELAVVSRGIVVLSVQLYCGAYTDEEHDANAGIRIVVAKSPHLAVRNAAKIAKSFRESFIVSSLSGVLLLRRELTVDDAEAVVDAFLPDSRSQIPTQDNIDALTGIVRELSRRLSRISERREKPTNTGAAGQPL